MYWGIYYISYNSPVSSVFFCPIKFTNLCSHCHKSLVGHFHHRNNISHAHLLLISIILSLYPRAPLNFCVFVELPFFDISYKWNSTISYVWLFSLRKIFWGPLRLIMCCYSVSFHCQIIFHCMEQYIFLSTAHLNCFWFSPVMNNATETSCVSLCGRKV